MDSLEEIRDQFPITKNRVFLNHAAQSPLPKPVAEAMRRYVDEFSRLGKTSIVSDDYGKPLFARLIGAKPNEIARVESTSVGLNIVANAIGCPRGSKIVTTDLEYPSVPYPWLRKGFGMHLHYVKNVNGQIMLDDVEKAVDDKTAAIAISHVEYVNGFRHDLRALSEIAHRHGAYMIVDAIQSVGTMPIDVEKDDVDFLATACYKWLLGPAGAGYLYVKDELIEKLQPCYVGWASVNQEIFETTDFWDIWNLNLSKTATRFEVGSPSEISFVGASSAMKMLLDFETHNIRQRIRSLTDRLIEAVTNMGLELQTPCDDQCRSGIVNFKIRDPKKFVEELAKKSFVASARANGVRVSPHFYNTEEEMDKLIEQVRQWRQHG